MARESDKPLPDAEREVLACLINRGQATAGQVRQDLSRFRPMAHGSVVTLLKRLLDKGLVTRARADRGRSFIYQPTRRAQPLHRRVLGDLVQRLFGGDGAALVSSLFESRPPTPQQLDRIQALLDERRTQPRRKRR